MTASTLRAYSLKDLAQMAKRRGVNGWHAMRKDQLVRAILRIAKAKSSEPKVVKKIAAPVRRGKTLKNGSAAAGGATVRGAAANGSAARGTGRLRPVSAARLAKRSRISKRIELAKARVSRSKDLAFISPTKSGSTPAKDRAPAKDRLVVMVRGPYWLHAYWELTPQGVVRAQAALGQDWHRAKPMLRLLTISGGGTTTASERVVRDIQIHGGVKNWYIDVRDPPHTYRLEIGYMADNGKFFSLARSNVITTPSAGASADSLDAHWNDVLEHCDKIYAMSGGYSTEGNTELQELFEERLRRPMGPPSGSRFGAGADGLIPRDHNLKFQIDAEMVVHGATQADAHVTVQGEPLKLRADGTFSIRLDLPNRRQVIPIVASTKDGVEQRTIVLAVERNTKVMEPLTRDMGE